MDIVIDKIEGLSYAAKRVFSLLNRENIDDVADRHEIVALEVAWRNMLDQIGALAAQVAAEAGKSADMDATETFNVGRIVSDIIWDGEPNTDHAVIRRQIVNLF